MPFREGPCFGIVREKLRCSWLRRATSACHAGQTSGAWTLPLYEPPDPIMFKRLALLTRSRIGQCLRLSPQDEEPFHLSLSI